LRENHELPLSVSTVYPAKKEGAETGRGFPSLRSRYTFETRLEEERIIIMKATIWTTLQSPSGLATFRRRLLRIHGTILALVALAAAVATTIARITGTGPFGFMQQNPMAWVGLFQSYLLMTIIAVLLLLGSGQANARKWDVVGALAHCPPLIVALSSLPVFASLGAGGFVWGSITFHLVFFCLETIAALYPDPSN
jgi:hypothetical protein